MDGFEDSQFQAAPAASSDGFNDFAAAPASNGGAAPPPPPLDDFFSGSAPAVPAPPPGDDAPPASEAVILEAETQGAEPFTVPAVAVEGAAAAADDGDAFFEHYVPTPKPAAAPAPEAADPRVEWRKQNAETLKKKDATETAAKAKVKEAAATHLAKFYEVRTTTLTQRKANNRKSEAHQKEVEVPASGTPWEKVNALVNMNTTHSKDVSRYKAVLIACKAKNVPIRAAA
ncbi:hypothetical protein HYH02_000815 [Chlamydomonas schloesseri]|uniref:Clathrin light chain n=1 Tax=Chlamydomonas schloesseri TaxID=2026947 RepID=A0A836BD96_9CHLO|nr:hypothetical protein HYH02_000811 [Chlamydomonas schloesseri]KAG2454988.1 hypothetical protein HYH02_000813 [Chlamydomonas schloesseri]KAG2454990.1 hypothetical protein HYH02_000815 [Chlamydomonas schloesseri]|eukprot:KAG2454985.1 hypothetical protein HYH02_000811 [Chlamydomonas schloesseri]